jgi:polar amino acid transport system substrate-binding protein
LQALDTEPFDGVLMDVNMPVMDGYTATARIRRESRFASLPVIAMTANAMAGDREKCEAAGMNDHISKPIRVREMFATLDRWIRPAQTAPAADDTQTAAPQAETVIPALDGIDVAQGLDRVLGNRGLYLRLLGKYRDSQQDFEAQFRVAVQQGNSELATRLAHTLKGVSGNIGAEAVRQAADTLERSCRENPGPEHLDTQLRSVVKALNPVLAALAALSQTDEAADIETAPLDVAALTPALSKLAGLLGDYDGDAVDALQELSAKFPGQLPRPALKRVQNLVEAYEFEPALEALRQLAGELRIELS